MSNARISTLAALLLGMIAAFVALQLSVAYISRLDGTTPGGLAAMVYGDRLVRFALGLAAFGTVFGLVSFLCQHAFVSRPLSLATERLRNLSAHGSKPQAEDCLSVISDMTGFRDQLAPLRAQFSSHGRDDNGLAHLPAPAETLVSRRLLGRSAVPAWVSGTVIAALGSAAVLLLVWGLATGASAQAIAQIDPQVGHSAGVLIGARSGGIAFALALAGTIACLLLVRMGYKMSDTQVNWFLTALNGLVGRHAPFASTSLPGDPAIARSDTQLAELARKIEKLTSLHAEHQQKLAAMTKTVADQMQAIPTSLQAVSDTLTNTINRNEEMATSRREIEHALLQQTSQALIDVRVTLEALQARFVAPAASGMPRPANPDLAQRLSSAMRSLKDATEL